MAVLVLASFALGACESLEPPQRLVADLQMLGLPAALGNPFNAVLLGGDGTTVCVGDESVEVHEFVDVDAAIDAAETVDRNDPSHVGNGIVEWAGAPRFWLRDRAIVLYVGFDRNVDAALRNLLGRPFAETDEPGRGIPGNRPPCQPAT